MVVVRKIGVLSSYALGARVGHKLSHLGLLSLFVSFQFGDLVVLMACIVIVHAVSNFAACLFFFMVSVILHPF